MTSKKTEGFLTFESSLKDLFIWKEAGEGGFPSAVAQVATMAGAGIDRNQKTQSSILVP